MKEDQRIGENIRVDTKVIEGDCPHRSVAHMDANFLEVLDLRRNLRERVERDGTDGDVAEVATAEFADLLCTALERTPSLRVPVVARLVGNRVEEARSILAARRPDIAVEEALDAALEHVDVVLRGARA